MAGFRLWEQVSIEDLLQNLTEAALAELKHEGIAPSQNLEDRLGHSIKRVLNRTMYASPACGSSSLCLPSEEGRAKPWSPQSASWGLVSRADPTLEQE